jgi:hypothetical protein
LLFVDGYGERVLTSRSFFRAKAKTLINPVPINPRVPGSGVANEPPFKVRTPPLFVTSKNVFPVVSVKKEKIGVLQAASKQASSCRPSTGSN